MSIDTFLNPPDPEVYNQVLADREDAYARQGELLKRTTQALIPMALITVIAVATTGWIAYWAITNEQMPYAMMIDENDRRSIIEVAGSTSTEAGRLAAARYWIDDALTVTLDPNADKRRRLSAIARLDASNEDKDTFKQGAFAEVDANAGYVHTIERVEFDLPTGASAQNHDGLSWEATVWIKEQDMREGIVHRDPTVIRKFRLPVQMRKIKPSAENLNGLAFTPFIPREIDSEPAKK